MARSVRQATLLLLLCGFASQTAQGADVPGFRRRRHGDAAETGATLAARQPPPYPDNVIDMPVDHYPLDDRYKPHTTATFQQHYLFDATYYQPGGPVFLYVGGETSARSRASNLQTGIVQILMNATGGLGVILENRYYGNSYPFDDSTTDHLVYLTNEQTIADAAYFAQHVVFPGINESLTAPGTPWILYGGSLAGGQTAMALKAHGDVLYAGIASSGIISVKLEYPEWYSPIQKYAPSDCVRSINDIVDKFDALVAAGNTAAIARFQSLFGLESIRDLRDFAATIAFPLGGPLFYPTDTWQELSWQSQQGDFWSFCSAVTDLDPPDDVRRVDYALAEYTDGQPWTNLGNYARYVQAVILATCPSGDYDSSACFGTQNQTFWADESNAGSRSYLYTICTEGGLYQAAPRTGPSLVSRVLDARYNQQWCDWAFPAGRTNAIPRTPDLGRWNRYGGLAFRADRLAFVDGSQDPWLDACYHAEGAPLRRSSDAHPEYLIVAGGHHWDSSGIRDVEAEPQFIREVHRWEIRTVKKWLRDFPQWKPGRCGPGPRRKQ